MSRWRKEDDTKECIISLWKVCWLHRVDKFRKARMRSIFTYLWRRGIRVSHRSSPHRSRCRVFLSFSFFSQGWSALWRRSSLSRSMRGAHWRRSESDIVCITKNMSHKNEIIKYISLEEGIFRTNEYI